MEVTPDKAVKATARGGAWSWDSHTIVYGGGRLVCVHGADKFAMVTVMSIHCRDKMSRDLYQGLPLTGVATRGRGGHVSSPVVT